MRQKQALHGQGRVLSILQQLIFLRKLKIRRDVARAIRRCVTIEELKAIAASTPDKDLKIDRLLVKRLEELESEGQYF